MTFIKEKKKDFLDGRTTRYLANRLKIAESYLSQIFNAKRSCSNKVARRLCEIQQKEIEKYFI